jgi:hypothetical protein
MKKIYFLAIASLASFNLVSQDQEWVKLMADPNVNFYEVQKSFNTYFETHDKDEKSNGYKAFKRWEYFMEKRVYPTGDRSVLNQGPANYEDFLSKNNMSNAKGGPGGGVSIQSTTWTPVGPMGSMSGVASNGFPRKAGRYNFVTLHPTNPNIMYCGAPAGGLWVTTNGGTTWTTNTDNLSVTGCTDLAIDPANPNVMYLATGDGYAQDTYAIGVLKSTDGGLTWNPTGLNYTITQLRSVRRILINPNNPQMIFAATNVGIQRSLNGGASWSTVNINNIFDMEFKPGNPNIIYAAGLALYRSLNGGSSFSLINSGIPSSGSNRMSVAVTPADSNYVYVTASSNSNSCLLGFYRSTNGATSFSVMTTSNILANACNATGTGCQGWYDLCTAVSPTNRDEVAVGGVNVWRTTNGGSTFTCIGCWLGTGSPPFLKADHHDLDYSSTGTLYSANDGGICRYNGSSSWTDIVGTANIAQIYKIGTSATLANFWITGHQDNGSNIYNGSSYNASLAGDGMDCFVDRTNNNILYASQYNGSFDKSTNGGATWNGCTTGLTGSAAWVAPWKQDPVTASTLYAGYSQMFRSLNSAGSWTQLTATGGSGQIVEFAIAPSNNQVIYVIHGTGIFKTTNAGTSWTNVTGTIPVGSAAPENICIDPTDPNNAWVVCSSFSAGNKVFVTTNGGTSWTNISANLPNLPANCIVYEPGSPDRVYVGMDIGVYFRDNSLTNWVLYNGGLPNTPVSDMEISPAAPGKIRAATYGRGVWEVDVIPALAPVTNFTVASVPCTGQSLTLLDQSTNVPSSWSWSITPTAGVSITTNTLQNPTATFTAAGTYTVSLFVSNTTGPGTVVNKTITVNTTPVVSASSTNSIICTGQTALLNGSGASTYTWNPGPVVGASVTFTPASTTAYTVTGTSAAGCNASAVLTVTISTCTGIDHLVFDSGTFSVFPNPTSGKLTIKGSVSKAATIILEITDVLGKSVLKQSVSLNAGENSHTLNISNFQDGMYFLKMSKQEGKTETIRIIKD